jgi:hypothetical protein
VFDIDGEQALEQACPTHARGGRERMIGAGVRVMVRRRPNNQGAQLRVTDRR